MRIFSDIKALPRKASTSIGRFWRDKGGIGAVEFALIAPLMFGMFIASVEASMAISINRKMARISSTVSDIITQSKTMTKSDIEGILGIARVIMEPYPTAGVNIRLVAIRMESGTPKVHWMIEKTYTGGYNTSEPDTPAYNPGDEYADPLPTNITADTPYFITSIVTYNFVPLVGYRPGGGPAGKSKPSGWSLPMKEQVYLRPRLTNELTYDPST